MAVLIKVMNVDVVHVVVQFNILGILRHAWVQSSYTNMCGAKPTLSGRKIFFYNWPTSCHNEPEGEL